MYDDLERLDTEMKDYETKHPGVGKAGALLGPASHQKASDFTSAAVKSLSNWGLGVLDPDYQKYLQNQARAGNIISQVNSKRGTEYQSLLDIAQSGQVPGDAPEVVTSKQLVRANAIAGRPKPPPGYVPRSQQTDAGTTTPPPAPAFQNALTPGAPAAATTPAPATTDVTKMTDRQVWDATLRQTGAKWMIDHNAGPRPPGP